MPKIAIALMDQVLSVIGSFTPTTTNGTLPRSLSVSLIAASHGIQVQGNEIACSMRQVWHLRKSIGLAFVIPPSRLHEIERKNKIPTIHRLYTLAVIYGRTWHELLSLYGIDVKPVTGAKPAAQGFRRNSYLSADAAMLMAMSLKGKAAPKPLIRIAVVESASSAIHGLPCPIRFGSPPVS